MKIIYYEFELSELLPDRFIRSHLEQFILVEKDANIGFLNLTSALISNNKFIPNFLSRSTRGNSFKFISIQTTLKKVYGFFVLVMSSRSN